MNVRMPDGTIVRNVPPGVTQEDLQERLAARAKPAAESAPAPSEQPEAPPTSMGERFATGLMDPVYGAAQIMERTGIPGAVRKGLGIEGDMASATKQRDAQYQAPEGMDWARMAGNVANPMTWAGGGAGKVLPAAATKLLPRALARGATSVESGAVQGALSPTSGDEDSFGEFAAKKAGQAGLGAVLGRVLGGGGATAEAKALTGQGVRLTPGQAAGGMANTIEQKLSSLPITGDIITGARQRAVKDVQGRAIERATGMSGIATVDEANAAVSGLYQRAVPLLHPNPEGITEAAQAFNQQMANPELTEAHRKILNGLWDQHFANYAQLSGEGLKKLDSQLGFLARKYSGPTASPADQTLSDSLYEVLQGLRSGLAKGLPPDAAAMLEQANRGFRRMIPVNKAASARADEIATPRALQKAAARQAKTDVTRMPADPLLDPAVKVLGSTYPDSGTAGRLGLMNPLSSLGGLAAAGPAWLANTALGRRLMQGDQPGLAQAIIAALRGS